MRLSLAIRPFVLKLVAGVAPGQTSTAPGLQWEIKNPMTFEIYSNNALQHIVDESFSTTCPHCNALSSLSLVSAPRQQYIQRFKLEWVGFVFRCDACNQPVFRKSRAKPSSKACWKDYARPSLEGPQPAKGRESPGEAIMKPINCLVTATVAVALAVPVQAQVDGADPNARDSDGKLPFDYARDNDQLKGTDAYWKLNDVQFQ